MWSVTDSKCTLFMRDAQLSLTASICARSHSSDEIPFNCSHLTQVKRLPNLHLAVQAAHAVQTSATQATPQRARTATSTPTTKDVHTAEHGDFLASRKMMAFARVQAFAALAKNTIDFAGGAHHTGACAFVFLRGYTSCTRCMRIYIMLRVLSTVHLSDPPLMP